MRRDGKQGKTGHAADRRGIDCNSDVLPASKQGVARLRRSGHVDVHNECRQGLGLRSSNPSGQVVSDAASISLGSHGVRVSGDNLKCSLDFPRFNGHL